MIQATTMAMLLTDIVKQAVDLCDRNHYGKKEFLSAFHAYIKSPACLSHREMEVLVGLASGRNGREMADTMGIAIGTLRAHRDNLCKKLDLHGTVDIVKFALAHGLIEIKMEK